ncbi:hypothetical protein LJC34_02565 [Oscillospiraceae bacterium OttesenSCG-928-G22]|nr:hypothetical protein [Oscillospiraceae bacterium OttesenSCG-928-G22]
MAGYLFMALYPSFIVVDTFRLSITPRSGYADTHCFELHGDILTVWYGARTGNDIREDGYMLPESDEHPGYVLATEEVQLSPQELRELKTLIKRVYYHPEIRAWPIGFGGYTASIYINGRYYSFDIPYLGDDGKFVYSDEPFWVGKSLFNLLNKVVELSPMEVETHVYI